MKNSNTIFTSIQSRVLDAKPNAQVLLFGSRASGTAHTESDWDILVLLQEPVTKQLKRNVQDVVFPLSIDIGAFINLLIVEENDWLNNPSYYSLHQTINIESLPV